MLQLLSRYKGVIAIGVLLAMPLVLLYAQTKRPGARGPVVGVFVDVAAFLERGMVWAAGGIMDGIEHYATSVASWEELVALRREQGLARAWASRAMELEKENDELRALAKAVGAIDGPRPIAARVVARTGAPFARLFTIDVGSADGVRRGDGVVDKNGVVGQILAVGRRSSDVLLLTDRNSAVDVVVQRSRARGILRGTGSDDRYGAEVQDFDKLRDVRPGDAVVTSGLGARFPPGLFVGTVVEAQAPDDSLYLEAQVRPGAAFDRVEHVTVLVQRPPPRALRLGEETLLDLPDAGPTDAGPAPTRPPPTTETKKPVAGVDAGPARADAGPTASVVARADAGVSARPDAGVVAPRKVDAGVAAPLPAPRPADAGTP